MILRACVLSCRKLMIIFYTIKYIVPTECVYLRLFYYVLIVLSRYNLSKFLCKMSGTLSANGDKTKSN